MRLEQLQYLIEIAKYNSMMTAAENLHISQPSLTVAIKQLETELGVIIFNRSRKGTHLTKQGELIYKKALNIMNDIQQLYNIDEEKILGKISIQVAVGFHTVAQNIVYTISNKHPNLQQKLIISDAEKINKTLKKNPTDFILTTFYQPEYQRHAKALHTKYKVYQIAQSNIGLIAGKNSLLAGRKNISFSTLQKTPLCIYVHDENSDNFLCDIVEKHNVKLQRSIITTDYNLISEYVGAGQLYTLMTTFSMQSATLKNTCTFIPLKEKLSIMFVLLIPRDVVFTTGHELFFNELLFHYPNMSELT